MLQTLTPPSTAPAGETHTWALELSDAPDALMRVLSLLRRRRCEVLGAHFEAGDRHRPGTCLHVRVRCTGGRPDSLTRWLAGLTDVLDVEAEA